MADSKLTIEIAYATPESQCIVELSVEAGTQAREAVMLSGLDSRFPGLDLRACPIGVFSRRVADDHALQAGDRVEIYRPLLNEPRDARRQRARD